MRALISVSDKTGVVEFARGLRELGWQVIATGGGAVVAEENRKLLSNSGFVVFLDRDIRDIALCVGNRERPLLRTHTLAQLAEQRRSWYLDCADAAVHDGTAEQLTEQIAELWRKR